MPDTPVPSPSVFLAQDLRSVLPIGIPLGWQPQTSATHKSFAVRRGGRNCYLDEEGQQLWAAAWRGPTRKELIDVMAALWQKDRDRVAIDLDRFLAGCLLAQLGGDWREDWDRIALLRILPRAFVLDSDKQSRFRLVSADGRWEVWLGGVEYAVWSFCDGTADLGAAVREVAKATGLQVDLLKRRSHSLLVAAVRIKAVFLDQPAPREVPD